MEGEESPRSTVGERSMSGGLFSRYSMVNALNVSICLDYLPNVYTTFIRLNTATLRTENFSGDLKTEVERLQEENNAMAESIMHNRIAIFVLAILVLLNLVLVVWLAVTK